ncbi:MAG: adenylate/guanylate cyclase domain-containing protein [Syntrophorhabdaceae bacterium]|nr:adenylate/guanylate cyclase domain-containing protein [Syntrophorhabdaceae bacterium]MDD4195168.1 adenylate/guanylate cyclase domain-containing protein [Syntrophorhabdaceae bacterium]
MVEFNAHKWIDSKEVLKRSEISRATLNNYIKRGIIPKPVVRNASKSLKGTRKIGYFPVTVLDIITEIKKLKGKGKAMDTIAQEVGPAVYDGSDRCSFANSLVVEKGHRMSDGGLNLTLDDITTPAYLLNYEFEIEWINEPAEKSIFGKPIRSIRDVELRNVFRLFLSWEFDHFVKNREEVVEYHMSFYRMRNGKEQLGRMYTGMSGRETEYLESVYDRAVSMSPDKIHRRYLDIEGTNGSLEKFVVYTTFFREGMFFLYQKAETAQSGIPEFLSDRETVVRDLLTQRLPTLVSFSVLVADLQNSVRICAELPPEEYFELINSMWRILEESFRAFHGIYGKRIGDGVVYYFLKKQDPGYLMNSINCALSIREKMADFSAEWKARKRWFNDLYLNMGINEGQEYFSTTTPSSTNIEFTALGDTINYASRLSNLARFGAILTTKNAINHLSGDERNTIRYGVRKRQEEREIFVENVFSRVDDLLKDNDTWRQRFTDIATLPVTEITDAKVAKPKV